MNNTFIIIVDTTHVACTDGTTDLFASTLNNIGSVRVCVNDTWRKVCGIGNTVLNDDLASVACSSAGFSKYGKKTDYVLSRRYFKNN